MVTYMRMELSSDALQGSPDRNINCLKSHSALTVEHCVVLGRMIADLDFWLLRIIELELGYLHIETLVPTFLLRAIS